MPRLSITVPYRPGYDYGVGADLTSGSPMNKVVEGVGDAVADARAATVGFEISRIETTSELETKLGISAEASYGCGTFGAGISARFKFARDQQIQTSSIFLAITATIDLAFHSIDEPTLTPAASQLADQPNIFASRYGNMFVRGIGRGGLLVGVVRIDTSSSTMSQNILAELKGSYGLFSAAAKTTLQNIQNNYNCELNINIYHEGGPIDLTMNDINDPSQMYDLLQQWLKSFQDDAAANARPYYVTLAPIAIANGPIPPNEAELQHAQDILMLCAKRRSALLDGLNLMDYIISNPSRYDFVSPIAVADVAKASAGFQSDLDIIARAASRAINDPAAAITPAEFAQREGEVFPQGLFPSPMPTLKAGESAAPASAGARSPSRFAVPLSEVNLRRVTKYSLLNKSK